jgi:hypothetical protein
MARAACFSAPLSGAAPFLRTRRLGWGLLCHVSACLQGLSPGICFPQLVLQLFVITGEAATSRSRSSQILRGWWFVQRKDFTGVLIAAGRARKHHQQRAGVQYPTRILIVVPRPLPAGAPLLTCSFGGKYSSNPQRFFLDFTYQMFKKAWFTTTPR